MREVEAHSVTKFVVQRFGYRRFAFALLDSGEASIDVMYRIALVIDMHALILKHDLAIDTHNIPDALDERRDTRFFLLSDF